VEITFSMTANVKYTVEQLFETHTAYRLALILTPLAVHADNLNFKVTHAHTSTALPRLTSVLPIGIFYAKFRKFGIF